MKPDYIWYLLAMALTTYLIRMLPLTLFRKRITSRFARSFFHYIPYAVLSAMTFPAILSSTGDTYSALAGLLVSVVLAYVEMPLIVVALAASLAAFLVGLI